MYSFQVPDIGEGVVEAEVIKWLVAEGDTVTEDQVLVELLTDKAEIEIPSPKAGRVHRIHFEEGQVAQVGQVLIEIDDGAAGETAPKPAHGHAPQARPAEAPARAEKATPRPEKPGTAAPERLAEKTVRAEQPAAPLDPNAVPSAPERPRARESAIPVRSGGSAPVRETPVEAVPAVRELAKRLGVDLAQVRGTGPRGRIMRRDVEGFQAGGAAAAPARELGPAPVDPEDWTRTPLRGLRRTIAERMSHSRHTAAHFTYVEEIDVTKLMERISGSGGGVSPLAFIAHASVRALAGYPVLNASIDDARGEIVMKGHVHLGIATATKQGLIVPVIRDAAQIGVPELAVRIAKLAEGAREGSLGPGDLRGSTFTITSLGKLGGVISTPILNHPEVGILGVNAIRKQARVIDDAIVVRSVMNLSISVDHRIADGVVAAQYVGEVKRILEEMEFDER